MHYWSVPWNHFILASIYLLLFLFSASGLQRFYTCSKHKCETCVDQSFSYRGQKTMTRSCSDNTNSHHHHHNRCVRTHKLQHHHHSPSVRVHSLDVPKVSHQSAGMTWMFLRYMKTSNILQFFCMDTWCLQSEAWRENRLSVPVYPDEEYNIPYSCPSATATCQQNVDFTFRNSKVPFIHSVIHRFIRWKYSVL